MRQYLLSLFLVASLALSLGTANAQVPRSFSYQGVVMDNSGHFISDGPHNILLKLYDSFGAVTEIYSENQIGVVFVKGLFNVMIGSVTAIPSSLAFDKGYFLGVSVDGGAEMTPRTPLSAAPYAIRASVADALSPNATGVVTSVNTQGGAITIQGGGGTTVTNTGSIFTISSSGSGGTGIQGVQNGDASIAVTNPNGPTATIKVADNGITAGKIAANAVGYVQIAGNAVGTAQLVNGGVTPAKLDVTGSTNGQVLTSNGSTVSWQTPPGGGLTLPYTNSIISGSDLFSLTNGGTGAAVVGVHGAATGTTEGIRGESNSTANSASAIHGIINPIAPGSYSAAVKGENKGTAGSGIGVIGTQAGSGWGVYGEVPDGVGIYGLATNNGTGVYGSSTKGSGGTFAITNSSNSNSALNASTVGTGAASTYTINNTASGANALNAVTSGTGGAGYMEVTNTSPTAPALEVKTASTAATTIGIFGLITGSTTGVSNVATAVVGEHDGTNGIGIGVWGKHAGTGTGVFGSVSGNGGYGVIGTGTGVSSTAVQAFYNGNSNTGTALELKNGFIKVSGNNKTAYVHTTAANNIVGNSSLLNYPGMAATDIVFVTHAWIANRLNTGYGVWWNGANNAWEIFTETNPAGAMPPGETFNVLVIRQ